MRSATKPSPAPISPKTPPETTPPKTGPRKLLSKLFAATLGGVTVTSQGVCSILAVTKLRLML